jgi:hypothetical protein
LPRRWKCGWKLVMSVFSFSTVKPSVWDTLFGGMSRYSRCLSPVKAIR